MDQLLMIVGAAALLALLFIGLRSRWPRIPDARPGDRVRAITASMLMLPPEAQRDGYYTEGVVERINASGDLMVRETNGTLTRCFAPGAVILRRGARPAFVVGDRVTSLAVDLQGPWDDVAGTVTDIDGDMVTVRTESGQAVRCRSCDTRHVPEEA